VEEWSARATWQEIEDPAQLYQTWSGKPYTMVFGVAMLPEQVPGVSLQACANGAYNAHWREFGRVITSYGLGRSVIRLGWEFNGNWYVWQASQPSAWAECWRQIVTSTRSTAPHLLWDWNVNRGVSSGLADATKAWPGGKYVDIVGVASYDSSPSATTPAGWQIQLNGPFGLNFWLQFATAHGKPLSVPEWGNLGPSLGGEDDPLYVLHMLDFLQGTCRPAGLRGQLPGGHGLYRRELWPRHKRARGRGRLPVRILTSPEAMGQRTPSGPDQPGSGPRSRTTNVPRPWRVMISPRSRRTFMARLTVW
jgi:hypothetical protein